MSKSMQLSLHYDPSDKLVTVRIFDSKTNTAMDAIMDLEDAETFAEHLAIAVYKLRGEAKEHNLDH